MMAYPWGRTHLKRLVVPAVFFLALYLCVVALGTRSKGVLHSTERPPSSEHQELPLPKEKPIANTTEVKTILFWTKYFGTADFHFGLGQRPFDTCPEGQRRCLTTTDRTLLNRSDAVVFHMADLDVDDLPPTRLAHQRWIFFLLESPEYTPSSIAEVSGIFNWTMTYRRDSDVYMPYQGTVPAWSAASLERVRHKSRLAAWFVSNCLTLSRREKYVELLQRHVAVDVYGACGPSLCPADGDDADRCPRLLATDYKFYLAFENSVCRDYVTEKWHRALANDVVPVVLGGADYAQWAPEKSFIDVRNFVSPRHLATYLKYLDGNQTAYEEFFEWRKTHKPVAYSAWCRLCQMLGDASLPERRYADIRRWWIDEAHCGRHPALANVTRLRRLWPRRRLAASSGLET